MRSFSSIIKASTQPQEKGYVDISKHIAQQLAISPTVVKQGIRRGNLRINNKPIYSTEIFFRDGIVVKFGTKVIEPPVEVTLLPIDKFIKVLISEFPGASESMIPPQYKLQFCAYLLEYFSRFASESQFVDESLFEDLVQNELEILYKDHFKESDRNRIPKQRELIDILLQLRLERLRDLQGIIENLQNGVYNISLYKFLQDYNKCIIHPAFAYCIAPALSSPIYSRAAVESLIKPIYDAVAKTEVDAKFNIWETHKGAYEKYLDQLDDENILHQTFYKSVASFLFSAFKKGCETIEHKPAKIVIAPIARKYNFFNHDRGDYELLLAVKNSGEGLAREVVIAAENTPFIFDPVNIGVLKPEEERDITIPVKLASTAKFEPILEAHMKWLNTSNESYAVSQTITFEIQDTNVPWEQLERQKPYTIQEIEEKEKLYGRDEILEELKKNILSLKIESYKIWGQKRVGKSSIVKTLKKMMEKEKDLIMVWRRISGLRNTNPEKTLNSLGRSLCSEIFEELDRSNIDPTSVELLKRVDVPEFDGSLYPLEEYIKSLRRINGSLKFVFILDEFDGINQEFFLPGKLGDTLSQNMGKGLNESNYVGFLLVGSENMHLLDRQSMNYNNFKELEVDTFDKGTQFNAFKNIIVGPVSSYLKYSNESIELIYSVTNGNPYFANLICSHILAICSRNKDNEVDGNVANKALSLIVNSSQKSHFDHFWSDGITEESNIKKERKTDIRRRILIGYSFYFFQTGQYPNRSDIVKSFRKPSEYVVENYEIENTISEFFNRKIFYDEGTSIIRIKPTLFERWLCGPGRTLMIEGISDLEALQQEKQLEFEYAVKGEELKRITESFIFRGNKIGTSNLQRYLNQFGGPIEQRRIFKLLDSLYYVSKDDLSTFFKREQRTLFDKADIKLKLGAKTIYREGIELYSFNNTIKENIAIVESFKVISHIRSTKTLKDLETNKDAWKQSGANEIIIFESVIDDFDSFADVLITLLEDRNVQDRTTVKLVVLIITTTAKAKLIKATAKYKNFKMIHYKDIDDSRIKPFIETTQLFETSEEAGYSFLEVRKIFPTVSKNSLTVLFEELCPGKSLPILWCETKTFKPLFPNEFASLPIHSKQADSGEALRTRLYHANRELSQALNSYLIKFLVWKAKAQSKSDWFYVDLVPPKVLTEVSTRWIEEGQKSPRESYFNFIHYKEIIKKHREITSTFQIGADGLEWCDKLNILRRDPAHPEKPAPSVEDVEYFEKILKELTRKMEAAPIPA